MKQKFLLIIIALFLSSIAFSQNKVDSITFTQVDSFARSISYSGDLIELTNQLTRPYTDKLQQARSLFIWVTNNIKYDYKFFNSGKEIVLPDCTDKLSCETEIREWENSYLRKILKRKKGVCDGYARLFKRMCDLAKIECEMVTGYARNEPYQVGIPISVNHAWNALRINNEYYFVDATWAAGYCTKLKDSEILQGYVKNYNDYYWCTPFERLARNHYPQDGKWIIKPNYTKEVFFNNPYYASNIIPIIEVASPSSGVLEAKKGDTIYFRFNYEGDIKKLQINSNTFRNPDIMMETKRKRRTATFEFDTLAFKKQVYIPFRRTGDLYEFEYVVRDNSLYYLELLFDYKKVMRYKIKVKVS